MSRGGRGRRGGGFGIRGGFGANNLPPMGLTISDIQNMSREENEMYPPMEPLPSLDSYTDEEKRICELQLGFAERLHRSAFYVVENVKSAELPRYIDKYRPSMATRPTLKRKDFHQPFFPPEIFDGYFNVRKLKKEKKKLTSSKVDIDEIAEDGEDNQEKSAEEGSEAGSAQPESDYDVDEEYDNDYAENYFDNGEEDDLDDLGGGGGADDGGGDYD